MTFPVHTKLTFSLTLFCTFQENQYTIKRLCKHALSPAALFCMQYKCIECLQYPCN